MPQVTKAAVTQAFLDLSHSLTKTGKLMAEYVESLSKDETKTVHDLAGLDHPLLLLGQVLPQTLEAHKFLYLAQTEGKGKGKGKEDKEAEAAPVVTAAAGGKEKKVKKARDPDAPKRPPSAYLEFQNSVREQYRKAEPELSYSEVLKKISSVWSGMSDADKKPWHDLTARKTTEFSTAQTNYANSHPAGWEYQAPEPVLNEDGTASKKRARKTKEQKAEEDKAKNGGKDIVVNGQGDVEMEGTDKKKKAKKEKKGAAPVVATPVVAAKTSKAVKVPVPVEAPSDSSDSDSSESDSDDDEDSPAAPAVASTSKIVESDSDDDSEDEDEDEEDQILPTPVKVAPSASKKKAAAETVVADKHKSKKVKA